MRTKISVIVGVLILALGILFVRWSSASGSDQEVRAAVAELRNAQASPTISSPSQTAHKAKAKRSLHRQLTASAQVLADSQSVSSFFLRSELAGLSAEQIARLEVTLSDAKRATYALLIDRAKVTTNRDGQIEIVVPAQGEALTDMKGYVKDSVKEIVGSEQYRILERSMGPKFDANFAYFGKYETTIRLAFDGLAKDGDRPAYVTMRNDYSGRIKATHVLQIENFEDGFFSLDELRARL